MIFCVRNILAALISSAVVLRLVSAQPSSTAACYTCPSTDSNGDALLRSLVVGNTRMCYYSGQHSPCSYTKLGVLVTQTGYCSATAQVTVCASRKRGELPSGPAAPRSGVTRSMRERKKIGQAKRDRQQKMNEMNGF